VATDYIVKSFAQATYLLANGFRPTRIIGNVENPVFKFSGDAREKGIEFIRAKNELSSIIAAAALDNDPDGDSIGNRMRG